MGRLAVRLASNRARQVNFEGIVVDVIATLLLDLRAVAWWD